MVDEKKDYKHHVTLMTERASVSLTVVTHDTENFHNFIIFKNGLRQMFKGKNRI